MEAEPLADGRHVRYSAARGREVCVVRLIAAYGGQTVTETAPLPRPSAA